MVGGRARTVGNPPISISRVSFFCHSTELTHASALHRPCRRMWLCWCYLACGPEPFSPLSASLCVQEADPSVFQPLLPHWLVSNLHQPMGSTGRRLEGERRTGRAKGGPGGLGCFLPVSPGSGTSDLTVSRSSVTTATPGTTAPSSTGFHPFLLPGQA